MTIISRSHRFIFLHVPMAAGALVKWAYQPHARWCDLVLGQTPQGHQLEGVYQPLCGLHGFNTMRQLAQILGPDLADFDTLALVSHPETRMLAFYLTAQQDVATVAQGAGLSLEDTLTSLRAGEAPQAFLKRPPIQAYLATDSFDGFVAKLLQLTSLESGSSLLSCHHHLQGPHGETPKHIYPFEALDQLWDWLEERIGAPVERLTALPGAPSPLLAAPAPPPALGQETRELLYRHLSHDYALYGYGQAESTPLGSSKVEEGTFSFF
jgi:hypothetical protein